MKYKIKILRTFYVISITTLLSFSTSCDNTIAAMFGGFIPSGNNKKLSKPTETKKQKSKENAKKTYNNAKKTYDTGDYTNAISYLDTSINQDPTNAEAYTLRGYAKTNINDAAGAVNDFTKAINLHRETWAKEKNKNTTIILLRKIIDLLEERAFSYKQLGRDAEAKKDEEDARTLEASLER